MDICDTIFEILSKIKYNDLSNQKKDILQWRLVSSQFYYTCHRLLNAMTAPTQFVVFLNNQELLGDYVDENSSIDSELNIVTKKGKQKRTIWIAFACTEGGYIVIKIRTSNRPEWNYEIRAVKGETTKDNKMSSLIQKYSKGPNLVSVTSVDPPSKGFEVEFREKKIQYTIKVIGKVPQNQFTRLNGNIDDYEFIEKRVI